MRKPRHPEKVPKEPWNYRDILGRETAAELEQTGEQLSPKSAQQLPNRFGRHIRENLIPYTVSAAVGATALGLLVTMQVNHDHHSAARRHLLAEAAIVQQHRETTAVDMVLASPAELNRLHISGYALRLEAQMYAEDDDPLRSQLYKAAANTVDFITAADDIPVGPISIRIAPNSPPVMVYQQNVLPVAPTS